ncbi:hypothetical protein IT407_01460 [Candidatus Uhrbacteria bacterium]|nr:hypothetical protein [Candidatus Uhrbacteria bacterium]
MRSIGCLLMFMFLLSGCLLDRAPLGPPLPTSDAGSFPSVHFNPEPPVLDRGLLPPDADEGPAPWPRTYLVGSLLVDHEDQLWMVVDDGIRMPVSGDDTLGYISLDESDAVRMTLEAERCLTPVEDYWGPDNFNWWPVYGPHEGDEGPFILDSVLGTRRPVSIEALESWGYYWRWMDSFDGGEDEWAMYAFDERPIPIRDGTLVHTEYGFYYVVRGRSFYFSPTELVAEAGYHPESALWMRDRRLRELAPASTSLTRESFDYCPAEH